MAEQGGFTNSELKEIYHSLLLTENKPKDPNIHKRLKDEVEKEMRFRGIGKF